LTSLEQALAMAEAMADKKAQDVRVLDLQGISLIADYFVIAGGNSKIQVQAIAGHVEEKLAEFGLQPLRREGVREGIWILLDYGAVVAHIFQHDARLFYNLEGLWGDAKRVALPK